MPAISIQSPYRSLERALTGEPRPIQGGRVPVILVLLAALALLLGGCGSSTGGPGTISKGAPLAHPTPATLVLDFEPNAVHAGIYRALAAGYYRAENLRLTVLQPAATADPLTLVQAGRAQFGLADGSDLAGAIARGGDAQAILAIAQRPLGGLIALASERLTSPAQLQGRSVGITGVPSDEAVVRTEVAHAGGDPRKVHVLDAGFNGAQALLAGRIQAFTGFIPADGVALQVAGHPITAFPLDAWGGPPYPGLVAFATRRLIASDPALVRAFIAATLRGYDDTLADPARSLEDLLQANPSLSPSLTTASLDAYLPLFTDSGRVPFGTLRPGPLEALSRWMLSNRLTARPVSPARYAARGLLPAGR
ncbi:MAG TPA: ABC transporter substrate-binding protein [Solirubrobacteraceae bacterium]|nr:ABC transporter substrate-binding protein [Solirubrobacteraceae bacterium]